MAGTVTGKNAYLMFVAHSGGTILDTNYWSNAKTHSTYGIGDFSLTLDRGTVEQDLLGAAGNYFKMGALSIEGSLTAVKFGATGNRSFIDNMFSPVGQPTDLYKYITISGTISTDTDVSYLRWCFASCQITSYGITMGDADTITELSVDFQVLNPEKITCSDSRSIRG